MFIRLLHDLLGSTLLLMLIWFMVNLTGLDKRTKWGAQMYELLSNLFNPALNMIRKMLPENKTDYSPIIFVFCLWILQKMLYAIS